MNFEAARLLPMVVYILVNDFEVPLENAQLLAPLAVQALLAHYAGDEVPDAETQAILINMIQSPEPSHTFGLLLWGIWNDPPPADNQTTVSLR